MANTFYFKINTLDAYVNQDGLENVIYSIHWSYFIEDEAGNKTAAVGVNKIDKPSAENFTPYEQLDEATIISWLEPIIDVEALQASLVKKLNEILTPTTVRLQLPNQNAEQTPAQQSEIIEPEA